MLRLIDSDILIAAHRGYYSHDICPGFWDWIDAEHEKGNIASIFEVYNELSKGTAGDPLRAWADERPSFFLPYEDDIYSKMTEITSFIEGNYTNPTNQYEFANGADIPLIATAIVKGAILVSNEKREGGHTETSAIKIPDICDEKDFKVTFEGNIHKYMREKGVKLGWVGAP